MNQVTSSEFQICNVESLKYFPYYLHRILGLSWFGVISIKYSSDTEMFVLSNIDTVLSFCQHLLCTLYLSSQYAASAQASCLSLFYFDCFSPECKLHNKSTYTLSQ